MKQEMDYSRYVDRYLDGVMSPEEEAWFRKELEGNPDLEAELEFQSGIDRALKDKELIGLEEQLDRIYEHTYRPVRGFSRIAGTRGRIVVLGSLAAAVLIAVLLTVMIRTGNPDKKTDRSSSTAFTQTLETDRIQAMTSSPSDVYATFYQPAEMSMSFRAAGDVVDSELREAMMFYDQKEYAKAIVLFEKILADDESRIGLNLYSGISHMELEEYKQANLNFRKIIDGNSMAFLESAEWYLGLCYLKTEELEAAKNIFRKIAAGQGFYQDKARDIILLLE